MVSISDILFRVLVYENFASFGIRFFLLFKLVYVVENLFFLCDSNECLRFQFAV